MPPRCVLILLSGNALGSASVLRLNNLVGVPIKPALLAFDTLAIAGVAAGIRVQDVTDNAKTEISDVIIIDCVFISVPLLIKLWKTSAANKLDTSRRTVGYVHSRDG